MSEKMGWIAVDLDGTLAEYHGWISEEHIGSPIQEMAQKVRGWIAEGKDVRIFTARADGGEVAIAMGNPEGAKFRDIGRITTIIQDWTEKHFGVRLPVTNKKDYGMVELWDDRCKQVFRNTGVSIESALKQLIEAAERANSEVDWGTLRDRFTVSSKQQLEKAIADANALIMSEQ